MRKKSKPSAFQVDRLEIRQLLSAVIYVSAANNGTTHNGTSWATAFPTLQSGLSAAALIATSSNPVVIKVGQGDYYTGGKTNTFQLLNHVAIDGGYAGYGQTTPDAREPATYSSVLSGQLGAGSSTMSYHVVTGSGTNSTAVLDGFTITDGFANVHNNFEYVGAGIFDNAGSPTLNDCVISGNTAGTAQGGGSGAGMANFNGSSPTLTNCTISGNTSVGGGGGGAANNQSSPTLINCILSGNTASSGGGMYNISYSSPVLTNCTLSGNTASSSGGGMANESYCSPALTNCTISGNTSSASGGGMANTVSSYPALSNCILWGDTAKTAGKEIYNSGGTVTITYSDINQSGFTGTGDISTDPKFIRNGGTLGAADFGDLRLKSSSSAINAGSNSAVSIADTTDLDGLSRIAGGHVDMGAYESHWTFQATIDVDANASGAGTGSDWADAYPNLAAAQDYALSGETIDVAQGTYRPTVDANRFDTFQLQSGVNLQGGFAGQANPTAAQNVSAYPTILSGVLVGDVIIIPHELLIAGNSYHVVTGSGTNSTAVLYGFTIIGGNANIDSATQFDNTGAGIFDNAGSPTISYCTITGNTAYSGGGMANYNSSSPTLNNCTLSGNSVQHGTLLLDGLGGGMFNDNASSPALTNCTISGNTAVDSGGGFYNLAQSNPTLTNCTISGNSANRGGGMKSANSSPTLIGCMVTGNSAGFIGGGISVAGNSPVTLINCTITGNTAQATGGGIDDGGPTILTNCIISGNTAKSNGGGIYNHTSYSVVLTNCTISGNTSSSSGGGMYSQGSHLPTLSNCVLWGDTASISGNEISGTVTITYSDIQGGQTGTGNINANPTFVRNVGTNSATDFGDLHLQFTSPAIDAGSNAAVPAGVTTDLDGNPRKFDFPGANNGAGAVVDMGAYELGYNLDEVIVPANKLLALPSGAYPFSANSISIAAGGTLDVADDSLVITYGTNPDPASSIASWLDTGYANGQWTGTGIISSATLGQPANVTGVGSFDSGSAVTIGRTWNGDANVDGVINADDLSVMMLGQTKGGTRWQDGNFNYGAQVNADDWMKLMYAVAVSKGQMLPVFSGNAAVQVQSASVTTAPTAPTASLANPDASAFAQIPIASNAYLSELVDSSQSVWA